jgi:hypothetical protein
MFKCNILGSRCYISNSKQNNICIINNIDRPDFKVMFPSPIELDLLLDLINRIRLIKSVPNLKPNHITKIFESHE